MRMHLGQTRHQVPVRTVDNIRTFCDGDVIYIANRDDLPVLDKNSLCLDNGLRCHRNDIDVYKCSIRRVSRKRLKQQESRHDPVDLHKRSARVV